jgi:hypothetical protein
MAGVSGAPHCVHSTGPLRSESWRAVCLLAAAWVSLIMLVSTQCQSYSIQIADGTVSGEQSLVVVMSLVVSELSAPRWCELQVAGVGAATAIK